MTEKNEKTYSLAGNEKLDAWIAGPDAKIAVDHLHKLMIELAARRTVDTKKR